MQRTFRRTIVLEVTYTDVPAAEAGVHFDMLAGTSAEELIKDEKATRLQDWAASTEYELLDDDMTEITKS